MNYSTRIPFIAELGVLGVALLIRVLAMVLLPSNQYFFGDAADYQRAAYALCMNLPYPDATELPFFRAPGLPLFLAVTTLCTPYSVLLGRVALICTDILSIVGLISITNLLGLNRKAQTLTALAFAISPLVVGQTLDIQSEPLFQCLAIWLTVTLFNSSARSRIFAGVLFGAAALTRPIALGFIPLIFCAIWQGSPKTPIKFSLLFLFGAAVAIAPWTSANYQRTGEFILINDAAGYNFWRGNHPIMTQVYNAPDTKTLAELSYQLEHELTPAQVAASNSSSYSERSSYLFQQGLTQLVQSPASSFSLLLTKCWVFLRPTVHAGAWPNSIWWGVAIWESCLYLFAAIGFLRGALSTRMRYGIIAYLFLGLVLSVPFQVVTRFRVPLYEWVLLISAASLLARRSSDTHNQITLKK